MNQDGGELIGEGGRDATRQRTLADFPALGPNESFTLVVSCMARKDDSGISLEIYDGFGVWRYSKLPAGEYHVAIIGVKVEPPSHVTEKAYELGVERDAIFTRLSPSDWVDFKLK